MKPDIAFILAAGYGTRLRPYTDECPKPMVAVGGVPMIDRTLKKLASFGVQKCVVNTHYKAEILQAHLQGIDVPSLVIAHEEQLLDTGGGIKAMIHHFKDDFFVISGDALWEDLPGRSLLQMLAEAWDPARMDILMVLKPCEDMALTHGVGDYHLGEDGRAVRALDRKGSAMFTSIRLNAPHIFDEALAGDLGDIFSYLELMDRAEQAGRLYGVLYDGPWHHISTPEDLRAVNASMQERSA